MNIYCDDGSTNVKLAWFEGNELQTRFLLTPSGMAGKWRNSVPQRSTIRWAR
jgi:hypothetical protein